MAPGVAGPEGDLARYRHLSLWWDAIAGPQSAGPLSTRPSLPGDLAVDVCIVGAGFTGLWTAHALAAADPSLRVVVVEKEVAGFGASGRNGGWCSALFATSDAGLARRYGVDAMRAMRRAMQATVDAVGSTARAEGIDCHFAKGGTIDAARTEVQRARAMEEVAESRAFGFAEEDLRWLDRAEAEAIIGVEGMLGATFTPHCAVIQPALLARGLAEAAERRGVRIFEHTEVTAIVPGAFGRQPIVRTPAGSVTADVIVRAVEAWTPTLPGEKRTLAPVYSLMVATEPLPDEFWATAGLHDRASFTDYRHMIIYGQRTADNRIAFGGRGAPYHFGSTVRPSYDATASVHRLLRETLVELFPALDGARFTHAWGGPLGIPRDWHSSVGYDRPRGIAWAGGYVGDGVSTTNLAGRTLADLITGADTELTHLPWVNHHSPDWEPEPLRWLGVNAGLLTMKLADHTEARKGRPSRLAARMERLLGQ